jgi:hypothetical protein
MCILGDGIPFPHPTPPGLLVCARASKGLWVGGCRLVTFLKWMSLSDWCVAWLGLKNELHNYTRLNGIGSQFQYLVLDYFALVSQDHLRGPAYSIGVSISPHFQ